MANPEYPSNVKDVEALLLDVRQLIEMGKHKKARKLLREIAKVNPKDDEVFLLFAHAAQKREQTIYCLNKALEINPSNEAARKFLASFQSPPTSKDPLPEEDQESEHEAIPAGNGSSKQAGAAIPLTQAYETGEEERKSTTNSKLIIFIGAGVLFIAIAGFLLFNVIGTMSSNARAREQFRDNANLFLLEGERLSALTEQGVTLSNFKDQLATVKSAYRRAATDWPDDFAEDRLVFDEAIEGWDLVHEIWEYDIDVGGSFLPDNSDLRRQARRYTGETSEYILIDEWIGLTMAIASDKFEEGGGSLTINLR